LATSLSTGLLRPSELFDHRALRWVLAAHNICFKNAFYAWFFSHGKSIPVVRGSGIYQQGVDFCTARLNDGQWTHVYPEGKVNDDRDQSVLPLKWGTARMIVDCEREPVVLPLYHLGMDKVLPHVEPYFPRVGHKVRCIGMP